MLNFSLNDPLLHIPLPLNYVPTSRPQKIPPTQVPSFYSGKYASVCCKTERSAQRSRTVRNYPQKMRLSCHVGITINWWWYRLICTDCCLWRTDGRSHASCLLGTTLHSYLRWGRSLPLGRRVSLYWSFRKSISLLWTRHPVHLAFLCVCSHSKPQE